MLSQVNENLINNIYNFRPAFNNLFEVFFIKSGVQGPLDGEFSKVMMFSCSGVNFNGEDLDIKRHNVTKLFYMDDYKRQDNLKLTFIENKDRVVRRYHENWMSSFYDRKRDCFKSYDTKEEALRALCRTIKVKFPKDEESVWVLSLEGVMIKKTPGLDMKWGEPSCETLTIEYAVSSWSLQEAPEKFNPGSALRSGVLGGNI